MKTLEDIREYSAHFASERNWEEFQTPKNIAMALSVEVAELLEHFQWLTAEQSRAPSQSQSSAQEAGPLGPFNSP